MPVPEVPAVWVVAVAPKDQSVPILKPVGKVAVAEVPILLKSFVTPTFAVVIDCCPQPVVAKVIKAAQIAMDWNLKRDFATPDFRP